MTRRAPKRPLVVMVALLVSPAVMTGEVRAQQPLLSSSGLSTSPTGQFVQFTTPVVQDSLRIRSIQQAVVPLVMRATLPARWNLEVAGGYTVARVETGSANAPGQLELAGPTDTRLRLYGPVIRDLLQINVAINAPTGLVQLDAEQFAVMRVVAAPALAMPAPVLGGGLGGTVGLAAARKLGEWALGAGFSQEIRTRFTPVEAALIGTVSTARLTPASVTRSSAAASRIVGRHQFSVVAGLDSYGSDLVEATIANRTESIRYRLGATRSIAGNWHASNLVVRSVDVTGSLRQRGAFRDGKGQPAVGSDGLFADANVRLAMGSPRRTGIELTGHLRNQSGLDIDPTVATAGVLAVGGGAALRLPVGSIVWRLAAQAERGTLNTGLQRAPFRAASLTLSIGPRTR